MGRRDRRAKARGLGAELASLREQSGMRLRDVAGRVGMSATTICRIENGSRAASSEEVTALLVLYRITGARADRLVSLARTVDRSGWWETGLTGANVVAGDAVDAVSVERTADGQDAAISAAVDLSVPPRDFFTASSRALATGLAKAGVRRLVVVGLASVLPGASGAPLMDEPGYPNDYRSFSLGHAAGLDELRTYDLDWVYLAPAGDFDHDGARVGRYRVAEHGDPAARITYADFAIALLDEIEDPRHHRAAVSITEA